MNRTELKLFLGAWPLTSLWVGGLMHLWLRGQPAKSAVHQQVYDLAPWIMGPMMSAVAVYILLQVGRRAEERKVADATSAQNQQEHRPGGNS